MHRNYCSRASIPTNKTVRRETTNKHKKNEQHIIKAKKLDRKYIISQSNQYI